MVGKRPAGRQPISPPCSASGASEKLAATWRKSVPGLQLGERGLGAGPAQPELLRSGLLGDADQDVGQAVLVDLLGADPPGCAGSPGSRRRTPSTRASTSRSRSREIRISPRTSSRKRSNGHAGLRHRLAQTRHGHLVLLPRCARSPHPARCRARAARCCAPAAAAPVLVIRRSSSCFSSTSCCGSGVPCRRSVSSAIASRDQDRRW